jgi:uncharacterized protein (TIGR02145 family)
LQGSATGTEVYKETYNPNPQTNANGLVSLEIGSGISSVGTFASIDWSASPYFLKTETDPTGGTSYTITGTSQLLSMPYALYAKTAGNVDALINQLSSKGVVVADVDGNIYSTVRIGSQVWMAENLKTTKYNDGTVIPNVTDGTAWTALTTGAYCDYNNTPGNSNTYGKLYNFYTVVDARKLCPTGWHVPSDTEWTTLITYLGGDSVVGGKLKETGTTHWNTPNTGATNETGFTALPGGYRIDGGLFINIGNFGDWWSSAVAGTTSALNFCVAYNYSEAIQFYDHKSFGFSVRCVRD